MKKIGLTLLIVFSMAQLCTGETLTITVDEAVDMAITQNLSLKQTGITLRKKERAKKTRWNVFLPSMALSAGATAQHGIIPFDGETPSAISDAGNLGLNAGLNLSLPLNLAAIAGSNTLIANYEAGLLDFEAAAKQLETTIRKRFFQILASEASIEIQLANIDLAQKRYEQVKTNYENGLASDLDILTAEVTLAGLQPAYNETVSAYDTLVLFFKNDLGITGGDEIELVGELTTEFQDYDAEELMNTFASKRLDIRSLDKQIESLEYGRKALSLNLNSPTLNLGYNYAVTVSNAEQDITQFPPLAIDPWTNWSDRGTLSLSLQWKFDGLIPESKGHVQIAEMRDSIESLKLTRELLWQKANTEIVTLVKTLETNQLSIEANTSRTALARKSYELTEDAYNLGTRELLEVRSAQNDYLAAQQQLLLSKFNYISALLDLEYALNTTLGETNQ